jgi:hypothetical protein
VAPPVPAVAVADTDTPAQIAPAAGDGVNVPAAGTAFTVTVAVPDKVAAQLFASFTEVRV